jgi:hypothetical protein
LLRKRGSSDHKDTKELVKERRPSFEEAVPLKGESSAQDLTQKIQNLNKIIDAATLFEDRSEDVRDDFSGRSSSKKREP